MIDIGSGPPVVLIPGVQGRWEWMRPAVAALARRCRVLTFSLCGEPHSGFRLDPTLGFDSYVLQVDAALEEAAVSGALVCGVSYGGLIAVRYAALRPDRVRALAIVSSPPPSWRPDDRVRRYLRSPMLTSPLFVARSPGRLLPEISSAFGDTARRVRFTARHLGRVIASPMSPRRMAERIHLLQNVDFRRDCARVQAPTLVVTGEPGLDRVVPVEATREYLDLIPGAHAATIERTGHIGLVTRPDRFSQLIGDLAAACQARPRWASAMLRA
jgi:pimeloyl-ACP methyl ester carboxylesterase